MAVPARATRNVARKRVTTAFADKLARPMVNNASSMGNVARNHASMAFAARATSARRTVKAVSKIAIVAPWFARTSRAEKRANLVEWRAWPAQNVVRKCAPMAFATTSAIALHPVNSAKAMRNAAR
jgi:hypothetical protein